MVKQRDVYIGVDIGKTKILAGIIDLSCRCLLECIESPTIGNTAQDLVNITSSLIKRLVQKTSVSGIGVGTFGVVNINSGMIISDGSIGSRNFPMKDKLQALFPNTMVCVDNDVNVAVLGEHFLNYSQQDVAMITIGTSIGVGAVIGGKLHRGKHFLCGEIAHLNVLSDELTLSQTSGGQGIIDRMFSYSRKALTTENIINMAMNESDVHAVRIITEATDALVNTIFLIQNLLDVDCIILGGSLTVKNKAFYDLIVNQVKLRYPSNYAFALPNGIQIKQASRNSDSCIWGGAVLCSQMM